MILGNLFYNLKDKKHRTQKNEETNIPVEKTNNKQTKTKLSNNQIGLQINLLVLTRTPSGPIL